MANKKLLSKLADAGVMSSDDAVRMADYTPKKKRSYDGAQISNLTARMTTQPKPIDFDIKRGLRVLRARSRHEAQNNDYVRRFLSLVKANVIGAPGIAMQARVIDPAGRPDPLANAAIDEGWKAWCKKGVADVTGKLSWKMIQRLYIETMARDGEVLIRKIRNWRGNKFRFALQFLDSELLDVEHDMELSSGNVIRMGVELNEWRRPVAYHLLSTKKTDDDYTHNGKRYIRVSADEIYHDFLPEWNWQTRGVPWIASGLLRLNMLAGYEEAELVASRAGASKFAVYEKIDDEAPILDPNNQFEKDGKGQFVQDFESGTVEITPEGYKLNLIDPQHPNSAYKDFVKACLRGISSGLGASYNSLANDLEGVNYNSLRKGALDERDMWMLLQEYVIESFCEEVKNDWLNMSLLAKAMTIMGRPLKVEREENYQRVAWQPRRWPWVDPLKEMAAHEKAFENKIRSPQSVIREMGEDPEVVLDEWEEWEKQLEQRKLKTEPAPAGSSLEEPNNAENADQDD